MPYYEYLAERLSNALARTPGIVEQRAMGGLPFLVNDVLCTRAHRSGGIMQRCLPFDVSVRRYQFLVFLKTFQASLVLI